MESHCLQRGGLRRGVSASAIDIDLLYNPRVAEATSSGVKYLIRLDHAHGGMPNLAPTATTQQCSHADHKANRSRT